MYNIVYFQKNIAEVSKGLLLYMDSIKNNIINNPTIFCDHSNIYIDNIPIFHSFFVKQMFHKNIILVNKYDIGYLTSMNIHNFICVYDSIVENTKDNYISYDYNTNDFINFLKGLYEKV